MSGMDLEDMKNRLGITIYSLESWYFDDEICKSKLMEHFKVSSLQGLGLAGLMLWSDQCGGTASIFIGNTKK